MTTDDDERLTVLFDTPSIYAPLAEWIEYRRWLVAEFGDRPIGKPYIQTASAFATSAIAVIRLLTCSDEPVDNVNTHPVDFQGVDLFAGGRAFAFRSEF